MISTTAANTKKSRGRPQTAFVSKKPKVKQSGPGRPKKIQETIVLPDIEKIIHIPKHTKPDDNKRKDAFILGMFLFSLIIFGASLYFSEKKQELTNNEVVQPIQQTKEPIIEKTGNIQNITSAREITPKKTQNLSVENLLVSSFYDALNKGTIDQIYPNINAGLKNSKLFKAYFSKTRTQRFLKNIDAKGIQIGDIQSDEKANPTVTYKLSYTLLNGKSFEETRQMMILSKESPQIGKLMCINTGCSKLPFFNPGKYAIH